jgi:hypothetical protein
VTVTRNERGQFSKGHRGGPGRRPGQRNRLTEVALAALTDHFAQFGEEAIHRVYVEDPVAYMAMIVRLLPKELRVERSGPLSDLTDDALAAVIEHVTALRDGVVKQLEGNGAAVIDAEPIRTDESPKVVMSLATLLPLCGLWWGVVGLACSLCHGESFMGCLLSAVRSRLGKQPGGAFRCAGKK